MSELKTMYVLRATPSARRRLCSRPIMRSTACTVRTRSRNVASMRATSPSASARWPRSHAGLSLTSASSNEGSRGAVSVAKRFASRGAGIAGECGANVHTLSMNGAPAATDWRMKPSPSRASTFVR